MSDQIIKIDSVECDMLTSSTEEILKSIIVSKKVEAESKQAPELNVGEFIEPLYDPLFWAGLMEINTRLCKSIRTYARNTVGLGWSIVPKKPITKKTTKQEKSIIEKEKLTLENFFENCNNLLPFEEICYRAKVDEEAMGNGYIEISRDITGKPNGVFQIPGHTVRALRTKQGYIQERNATKVYFKIFNGDFDMNSKDGSIKNLNEMQLIDRANELIPFQNYTPRDSYYGIPKYVSCANAIAGNQLASRRNLSFFKNDATPRMAITVTNGQLTSGSISDIKDFVNMEGKGASNAHRVMILQAKSKQIGDLTQSDVKIEVIPLTVGLTDDASFVKYRDANDEEIREAFGIGEIFYGSKGSVNRATASILREITNIQEFIPDAKVKEFMINQTICKSLGSTLVKFRFNRPDSLGELDKADIFAKYLQGGGVTPNDIRHELGKDEYTEEWGDKPMQIALVEYQMNLLGAQGAVSQGGSVDNEDASSDSKKGDNNNNQDSKNDTSSSDSSDAKTVKNLKVDFIIKSIQEMINKNLQTYMIDLQVQKVIDDSLESFISDYVNKADN